MGLISVLFLLLFYIHNQYAYITTTTSEKLEVCLLNHKFNETNSIPDLSSTPTLIFPLPTSFKLAGPTIWNPPNPYTC